MNIHQIKSLLDNSLLDYSNAYNDMMDVKLEMAILKRKIEFRVIDQNGGTLKGVGGNEKDRDRIFEAACNQDPQYVSAYKRYHSLVTFVYIHKQTVEAYQTMLHQSTMQTIDEPIPIWITGKQGFEKVAEVSPHSDPLITAQSELNELMGGLVRNIYQQCMTADGGIDKELLANRIQELMLEIQSRSEEK